MHSPLVAFKAQKSVKNSGFGNNSEEKMIYYESEDALYLLNNDVSRSLRKLNYSK